MRAALPPPPPPPFPHPSAPAITTTAPASQVLIIKGVSIGVEPRRGEGGIRTLDTAFGPYNGLANRRLRPLGHLSSAAFDTAPATIEEGSRPRKSPDHARNRQAGPRISSN